MGFRNNAIATVWSIESDATVQKYCDIQISTRRKGPDGEYLTDFSGIVRLLGKALDNKDKLKEGLRIRLTETDVTRRYDKASKQTYVTYCVFAWEEYKGALPQASDFVGSDIFSSNAEERTIGPFI